MIWNVTVPILVVAVIVLLWRVWRLEGRVRLGEVASAKLDNVYLPPRERTGSGDFLPACIPSARHVGEVRAEVRSLARALGYEWKRTEAKEGWERFAVADKKPSAPKQRRAVR